LAEKVAIDTNQNIYTLTSIFNTNLVLTTTNSHQPVKNIYHDAYLVKFNSSGIREWATYYGGEQNDYGYNLTCDNLNNVYICGATESTNDISTPNSMQPTISNPLLSDGFIVKFNENGVRQWGTYYGGLDLDGFSSVHYHENFLYIVGYTNSSDNITTQNVYNNNFTNYDMMIVKFDMNGNRIWGTYLGGNKVERISNSVLKNDNIYIQGVTNSENGIGTTGTFMPNYETIDFTGGYADDSIFIIKFNYVNQTFEWGTYFNAIVQDISVDDLENVYASGYTDNSVGISTPNAYMTSKLGEQKPFLVKLNSLGEKVWGTYVGGDGIDYQARLTIDRNNALYVCGITTSINGISTPNTHQTQYNQGGDIFINKFLDCQSLATVNSNSPICLGEDLNLTASGGTGYSWTGPNGFTSNLQNPIIPNTTSLNSGQYACSISGSGGCDDTITIDVLIGDTTKPIPDVAILPTITGDCNITISAPTATDNCSGNIVGTTTTQLNTLPSGSHTIVWSYNDGNGNIEIQNQTIIINQVTLPNGNPNQSFCIQQNATISDIDITGQNIKWYDSETGGNLLSSSTILIDGITYYASQTLNSCESSRIPITIQIQDTSAPTGSNQSFCAVQNPTLNEIVINGSTIKWYSDNISTTVLPQTTSLTDNTTYYATQTLNGCESTTRLPITINLISTLNANDYSSIICDERNDGIETTNLTSFNNFLITSLQGNTFTYYKTLDGAENQMSSEQLNSNHSLQSGINTIFVRIDSSNGCHQIVQLQLTLVDVPEIPILDEITLCETGIVSVNAGSGFNSYTWSNNATTQSIVINQAGNYWITVTKNHNSTVCSTTKNFSVVLSNKPTITSINTIDWTDFENSITVNVTGLGDYEYSIDGINFQESPVFNGLSNGVYTVTVQDTKECGIATKQVYLLNYPKFFTPNGDGNNDTWKVKFSQFEENFVTQIFDRYGKLIKVLNKHESWDGNYNGKQLPSDDYWFQITRNDGRVHKGHFAMLR
jgi:gliding motility-associated-like protein